MFFCFTVMPSPQRFSGESIIIWSDLDITISVPWYIGLMFRTRKVNGMLMQANAGSASKINIQVEMWPFLLRKVLRDSPPSPSVDMAA